MSWQAQTGEIFRTMTTMTGFGRMLEAGAFAGLDGELLRAVLDEAGKFAMSEIAPLHRAGDIHGCRYDPQTRSVTTPPGWKAAYDAWRRAGWAAAAGAPEYGGEGMPAIVSLALQELWNGACMAFGLNLLLTQDASETLARFGEKALKDAWLGKLISGECTGTMALTEPQAGSDLSLIRTMAEPADGETWRLSGEKIFITYGEHDLTENIVHMVLARTPGAPEGTRGLSLFLVPRALPDGRRNALYAAGMEHKMGIHGSPTVTLALEGATGWLVGEETRGLAHMFTMMNTARVHIGVQGVAIAERAFRQALAFARERRQGRRPGQKGPAPIIGHPDIRRMLLDMRTKTLAARAICYETAFRMDMARLAEDAAERAAHAARAALLTPMAKAFSTDIGVEAADAAVQIHGGMGYVEETGAAQLLRDVRITPIYEGTNGIQALDLAGRKIMPGGGGDADAFMAEISTVAAELEQEAALAPAGARLKEALGALERSTRFMREGMQARADAPLAAASAYLRLFSLVAGCAFLARGALNGKRAEDAFFLRHFAAGPLAEAAALERAVTQAAETAASPQALEILLNETP